MIALNEPYGGDLQGGVRNADLTCHRQARRAGLVGTFKAFISTRIQNLDSIVKLEDRELTIVNIKGEVVSFAAKKSSQQKVSQTQFIFSFSILGMQSSMEVSSLKLRGFIVSLEKMF